MPANITISSELIARQMDDFKCHGKTCYSNWFITMGNLPQAVRQAGQTAFSHDLFLRQSTFLHSFSSTDAGISPKARMCRQNVRFLLDGAFRPVSTQNNVWTTALS